MSALDGLFGLRTILLNGVAKNFKQTLNFLGGWTIAEGSYVDVNGKTVQTLELTPPGGGGGGTGDFVGPGASVADRIVAFNGTTGKLGKDSGYTVASVLSAALTAAQSYANSVGSTVTALIPSPGGSPANVSKSAASGGASASYSRQDHKHDLDTAAAGAFSVTGVAAAEGSSTSLARADHTHSLIGTLPITNGGTGATSLSGLEVAAGALRPASQLPARGSENVVIDLYPSLQQQGTLATASSVNIDVAISSGKRYAITADIWVDDGAGGACLYTKALHIKAHQTGGAAKKVSDVTLEAPLEGAGFTFVATESTTNIRFTLANTSGTTRSYNVVIGSYLLDKP